MRLPFLLHLPPFGLCCFLSSFFRVLLFSVLLVGGAFFFLCNLVTYLIQFHMKTAAQPQGDGAEQHRPKEEENSTTQKGEGESGQAPQRRRETPRRSEEKAAPHSSGKEHHTNEGRERSTHHPQQHHPQGDRKESSTNDKGQTTTFTLPYVTLVYFGSI